MTGTIFLMLLLAFSSITGLVTEAVKKILNEKENLSYNLIALITAMLVGTIGTGIFYQLNAIPFNINNIIYLILMGFASGIGSMVGYDKVHQLTKQILNK